MVKEYLLARCPLLARFDVAENSAFSGTMKVCWGWCPLEECYYDLEEKGAITPEVVARLEGVYEQIAKKAATYQTEEAGRILRAYELVPEV